MATLAFFGDDVAGVTFRTGDAGVVLILFQVLDCLTLRIAGAGHEEAEAAVLDDHWLATVWTFFVFVFFGELFDFFVIGAGLTVFGHAFDVFAFREIRAGEELAVATGFDDHGRIALVANLSGSFFGHNILFINRSRFLY